MSLHVTVVALARTWSQLLLPMLEQVLDAHEEFWTAPTPVTTRNADRRPARPGQRAHRAAGGSGPRHRARPALRRRAWYEGVAQRHFFTETAAVDRIDKQTLVAGVPGASTVHEVDQGTALVTVHGNKLKMPETTATALAAASTTRPFRGRRVPAGRRRRPVAGQRQAADPARRAAHRRRRHAGRPCPGGGEGVRFEHLTPLIRNPALPADRDTEGATGWSPASNWRQDDNGNQRKVARLDSRRCRARPARLRRPRTWPDLLGRGRGRSVLMDGQALPARPFPLKLNTRPSPPSAKLPWISGVPSMLTEDLTRFCRAPADPSRAAADPPVRRAHMARRGAAHDCVCRRPGGVCAARRSCPAWGRSSAAACCCVSSTHRGPACPPTPAPR